MNRIFYLVCITIFFANCNAKKELVETTLEENTFLDTMTITAEKPNILKKDSDYKLPKYNPTRTIESDIKHTNLDIRFDWEKEHVLGKATLTVSPWFYATDELELDAKNFDIHKVQLNGRDLKYDYDGNKLKIKLGRTYKRTESYKVFIDYTAKPSDRTSFGGSSAITSDKGLFFINADGADPNKPKQIWTQGETEHNSRWFPTTDNPIERTTQEIKITVDKKYKTLSNGTRVSSIPNSDGTRTDYYKMELSHAPYLFMLAVGEFAVVTDRWENIPLEYYVEPEFEEDAKKIFPYTPEMLTFFSEKLQYKYPWSKYSQIVVRDYVSGAMENTTAVIFGDQIQQKSADLIDEMRNEKIVAHEMMHHWFGDLVTCESWANLTLNEGFANYSEYLWLENKHGKDKADEHLYEEHLGYFYQAGSNIHPLINYGYDQMDDMFDAHSYNKGGAILHMLRQYVGDDAFFAACSRYLKENQFTQVEVDELRIAFEDVVGQDLNWFFNQWYLEQGHPELEINQEYDATQQEIVVTVRQTQNPDRNPAIFQLPTVVDIYFDKNKKESHQIMVDKRVQDFRFPASTKPKFVDFDPSKTLLALITEEKTNEEYLFQYYNTKVLKNKQEALESLFEVETEAAKQLYVDALNNDFSGIRKLALDMQGPNPSLEDKYVDLAKNDKHSQVRGLALTYLAQIKSSKGAEIAKNAIENEKSTNVIGSALGYLAATNDPDINKYTEKFKDSKSSTILTKIAGVYAASGDVSKLDFFKKNLSSVVGQDAFEYFGGMAGLGLSSRDPKVLQDVVNTLSEVGADPDHSIYRRFGSTKTLWDLSQVITQQLESIPAEQKPAYQNIVTNIKSSITNIKEKETHKELLEIYKGMSL